MIAELEIMCILAVLNFVNEACTCPKRRGLFLLSPHRYGGGYLRENKILSPVDGFSSVGATAFLLVQNQNIIAMLSKSTSATGTPIGQPTPESIIQDLIASDDISNLKGNLRSMLFAFMLSENDHRSREQVFASYEVLDILLSRVEKIENKINTVAA